MTSMRRCRRSRISFCRAAARLPRPVIVARAVCRRAERRCWSLARAESVAPDALIYLNRLSDLLFVLARVLARAAEGGEVIWRRTRAP